MDTTKQIPSVLVTASGCTPLSINLLVSLYLSITSLVSHCLCLPVSLSYTLTLQPHGYAGEAPGISDSTLDQN